MFSKQPLATCDNLLYFRSGKLSTGGETRKKRGDRELISTAQRSTKPGNVSPNNLPNLRRSSNRHLITLKSVFVKA